ncbi:MAG: cytochrome c [Desulfobacterales bacterium]|nr:cytochrome c [Desulfobacterales bacterium]
MEQSIQRRGMKQPDEINIESPAMCRRARNVALLSAVVLAVCIAPVMAQELAGRDLRVFYQQNCLRCHGPDGSAVSAEGKKLRGQDFTDPDWQRDTRDDEMVRTILKGKFFGLAMPRFKGTLTGDEAQRMVAEIIRKSKKGKVIAPEGEKPYGK